MPRARGLLVEVDMIHFETLTAIDLDVTTGGLKTEGRRQSYNVEDRRPGAPPQWRQTLNTWWSNFKNGYLY